jgi:hypothetical protein
MDNDSHSLSVGVGVGFGSFVLYRYGTMDSDDDYAPGNMFTCYEDADKNAPNVSGKWGSWNRDMSGNMGETVGWDDGMALDGSGPFL